MENNYSVWLITAKSNLHVGNENNSNFGLIDKAIQRDVLTGLPCIYSSSLKGALNEWASNMTELTAKQRVDIFGVDKLGQEKGTRKGGCTFFDANLLFLPVQDNEQLYKLKTCNGVLSRIVERLNLFGIKTNTRQLEETLRGIGSYFEIDNDKNFIELCEDDNLPIIARNVLKNGQSENLWYEQVLPTETVFYTILSGYGENYDLLERYLQKANNYVQIGANATIGYGYCTFTKLNLQNNYEQVK